MNLQASLAVSMCVGAASIALAAPAVDLVRIGPGAGPLAASQAVRVSNAPLAHTAQVLATDPSGALVGPGDHDAQIRAALENLAHALATADSSLGRIVRLNAVVESARGGAALARGIEAAFRIDSRPALTLVEGKLPLRGALVALDAVAIAGPGHKDSQRPSWLRSDAMAAAPGASHCGVLPAASTVYVSGRAADGSPAEATTEVLRQLDETLAFVGLDRTRTVQLKCFLQPISAAGEVRARIAEHFGGRGPPTVFVEWQHSRTIEIEAIAAAGGDRAEDAPGIEYLTPPGDRASPVFSRLVRISNPASIFVSTLNGGTRGRGDARVREMFSELAEILKRSRSDLLHLAKATYYVSDDLASRALNEIRPEFYDPKRPPAASKALVRGTALAGRSLAVDMIAVPVP